MSPFVNSVSLRGYHGNRTGNMPTVPSWQLLLEMESSWWFSETVDKWRWLCDVTASLSAATSSPCSSSSSTCHGVQSEWQRNSSLFRGTGPNRTVIVLHKHNRSNQSINQSIIQNTIRCNRIRATTSAFTFHIHVCSLGQESLHSRSHSPHEQHSTNRAFVAGWYLFGFQFRSAFSHSAITGFPNFIFTFRWTLTPILTLTYGDQTYMIKVNHHA